MTKNLHILERFLRLIFGVLLFGWAVAGGPWWGYCGVALISSAAWGFCPVYWSIKQ